jgi:hypothetical protein
MSAHLQLRLPNNRAARIRQLRTCLRGGNNVNPTRISSCSELICVASPLKQAPAVRPQRAISFLRSLRNPAAVQCGRVPFFVDNQLAWRNNLITERKLSLAPLSHHRSQRTDDGSKKSQVDLDKPHPPKQTLPPGFYAQPSMRPACQ